ncbi:prefoldin subunit [Ephemerocybe angulata]|uniref:Prefoldin subunit 3 n=1 Tax=Ephemerocybe angulata TaxID=980116 RepID=A0A8H6M2L0_9AGAR|nr:prefoldin subunit [Tulosesus angulatus]
MASKVQAIFSEERNPRGIPKAPFIANVDEYMLGSEANIETTLRAFQDAIAKYRYMEANLTQKRASLEEKIPDIRKTLDVVEYLQDRREGKAKSSDDDDEDDLDDEEEDASNPEPITTTYELNDTLYAEAQLEESDSVYLWLGANVMLSYKLPQAQSLLNTRLEAAELNLKNTIEDLEFLREQLTIMEVNTARVYNWDVKQRREKRLAEGTKEK